MRDKIVCADPNPLNPNEISFEEREKQLEKIEQAEQEERKKAKHSPFSNWTQFNNDATREMVALAKKNGVAMALLFFLVDQMDGRNAVVCSMTVLCEALGYSRRTIANCVKLLKDTGFIAVLKSGNTNVYTINDKVWWKSWGTNYKYSKFPANVVLSLTEQSNEPQKRIKTENIKIVKEIIKKEKDKSTDTEKTSS